MAMTSTTGRGMTTEERNDFLTSGAMFAKIVTTMADGWPVLSPVWYDWLVDEQAFLVVSKERTSMVQNLRRDPRCGSSSTRARSSGNTPRRTTPGRT